MSISTLINKIESNHAFRKVVPDNAVLNKIWSFLKTNPKFFAAIVFALCLFSIYIFGKNIGEFIFQITH